MKRFLLMFAIFLLLAGCAKPAEAPPAPLQPIQFFYRTAVTGFSDENGLIRAETRDLGTNTFTDAELFALYFQGPQRSDLVSPISSGTRLLSVERSAGILTIQLSEDFTSRSGIDHSIMDACLVKTGLQLEGIREVRIRVESRGGQLLRDNIFSESDILLYDSGEIPEATVVTLYYSDAYGKQLLAEQRAVSNLDASELPNYVVQQLIAGPQSPGMVSALPQGTSLLDIKVENGTCSVDFNSDFYENRPNTQQAEQLALLSVVNTLCDLEDVNQVQFYVDGIKLENYVYLSLRDPFVTDTSVVGPVREDLNEFEGTLCLPGISNNLLHRLNVRIRLRGNSSKEKALLLALFSRSTQNGLRNPLENMTPPSSVEVSAFNCTVDLAPGSLDGLSAQEQETVLRTIVATLAAGTSVRRVSFRMDNTYLTAEPMAPNSDWFCD